jgi:acyl-CoA thioesterase I
MSRTLLVAALALLPLLSACSDDTTTGGDPSGTGASSATSGGATGSGGGASSSTSGTATTSSTSGSGVGGAGGGPDPTAPIDIVVLGASTALGKNLDQEQYGGAPGGLAFSWVNRYIDDLGVERPGSNVFNLSMGGYGTYEALPTGTVNPPDRPQVDPARNITAAIAQSPDVIIVSYPSGGDLDDGISVQEIMDNFATIAATAAAANVPVWVTAPNPLSNTPAPKIVQLLSLRDQIMNVYGERALDFWTPRAGPDGNALPEYILLDGVHPNAEGHKLLFDVVKAAQIPEAVFGM